MTRSRPLGSMMPPKSFVKSQPKMLPISPISVPHLPSIPGQLYSDPFLPVGIAMFICTFLYMCIWVYTAEVTAKRIRERYLRSILRQDIAFFDNVGPGEITTRIQTDSRPWFSYYLRISNILTPYNVPF